MFFSVIITTYNRRNLVYEAIQSVIEQTFKDFEIIIVDDGSNDGTYQYIYDLIRDESRIKYYYKSNGGTASAKNFGIMQAKGEYITFLDSDDRYLPNHLHDRYEIIKSTHADCLYGGALFPLDRQVPDMYDINHNISLEECIIGGTIVIRTNLLHQIGGFDIVNYAEDSLLFEKIVCTGCKIIEVKDRTYLYNTNLDDSITSTIRTHYD